MCVRDKKVWMQIQSNIKTERYKELSKLRTIIAAQDQEIGN